MTTTLQHLQAIDRLEAKVRLLSEIQKHIGRHRAIGMAELYEVVYETPWKNRINDTRKIRKLITELRQEGQPICSVADQQGGGYYLAQTSDDLASYLDRQEHRALKILARNARMKKLTLPDYVGQVSLRLSRPAAQEVRHAG